MAQQVNTVGTTVGTHCIKFKLQVQMKIQFNCTECFTKKEGDTLMKIFSEFINYM